MSELDELDDEVECLKAATEKAMANMQITIDLGELYRAMPKKKGEQMLDYLRKIGTKVKFNPAPENN